MVRVSYAYKVRKFREPLIDPSYAQLLEESGMSLPPPVFESITKSKQGVDDKRMSKRAKKLCTTQEDVKLEEIDEEEEEDPEEEEEDGCIPQEEEEVQEEANLDEIEGEQEEIDPEEEENGCNPQEEDEPVSATPCEKAKATSLRQLLPEIALAAQHLEAMEEQLNGSRQQILELKREKAELECRLVEKDGEFQSRMERVELEKKAVEEELVETRTKLTRAAQKAKELFEIM